MQSTLPIPLTNRVAALAASFPAPSREQFDFKKVEWAGHTAFGTGFSGPTQFRVSLDFKPNAIQVAATCSLCGQGRFCPHSTSFVSVLKKNGIADSIEKNDYANCSFSLSKVAKEPENQWASKLGDLAKRLSYSSYDDPIPDRFPAGRQAIYVIQHDRYSSAKDMLPIQVATRPLSTSLTASSAGKPATSSGSSMYRDFCLGVRVLASSTDELDREVAEKIALGHRHDDHYGGRHELRFSVPIRTSMAFIAKLARSGRLFHNAAYQMHQGITLLGWLSDEKFDLKFEIAASDKDNLSLGACAKSSAMTVSHNNFRVVSEWYFIDDKNRLALFRRPVPPAIVTSLGTNGPIVVPRQHAGELIEQVMAIPAGLGIEFVGCDDLRPTRVTDAPRPRIHIKAPQFDNGKLEAKVQFDYQGIMVPLAKKVVEFYDKKRLAIVQVDTAFHDRSTELLVSLGVKIKQSYGDTKIILNRKKVPLIVGQLINHGWHVEADGKLYRTGSKFDLNVVSGIDWFELQGKAHFDEASIDLPALIQCLRSGERSIVLDDGTIGMIPEQWVKQFGALTELSSGEDGAIKFGRSQVGLLDALLMEQGQVNVDEKFDVARQALRNFDRIGPTEPPAGFIGTLRPYQKIAQGWFEFLRQLGFGGCLADDMGLGKTIQVLSLLEHRRELKCGPSLIVVPRSLVFNWTAEASKFAPQLRVLDQSHSQRVKGTGHLTDFDLVITTYGTLRRDAAFLKDFEFDYVILDEAQAIKNATTEASKAVRLLQGKHKLALSGTPIENHLGELWSLFDFLNPGMLGRVNRFAGLAQDADADQRNLLAAAVRPFILRRTKKQVAPELPERVEQTIIVELDAEQRKAYDELREYYRQKLLNKIDNDGIGKSQMVILEALLRLRQAACHPGLIDKARVNEPSAKVDELLTRLTSASESGDRVLVFSQFTSLLAIVKSRLKQARIAFLYLDGKTKDRQSLVNEFQSGSGPAVFLISLKAGGVGLNLTAARTVYLLDPWWNPAVEAQAIDRAHRIGQQQTVFATRLITADTVEQKVLDLQNKKKGLADAIVNADNAGISSLTREDLELLLA